LSPAKSGADTWICLIARLPLAFGQMAAHPCAALLTPAINVAGLAMIPFYKESRLDLRRNLRRGAIRPMRMPSTTSAAPRAGRARARRAGGGGGAGGAGGSALC